MRNFQKIVLLLLITLSIFVVVNFYFQFFYFQDTSFEVEEFMYEGSKEKNDDFSSIFTFPRLDPLVYSDLKVPHFSSYPPMYEYMGSNKDYSFLCNGEKNIKFPKYEELAEYFLSEDIDYKFDEIPVAMHEDPWFDGVEELIQKEKAKKRKMYKKGSNVNFKLAVIIPIRGRCDQIKYSLPYLHWFLQKHVGNYRIFLIEMSHLDEKHFNKAAIMNIGVILANNEAMKHELNSFDYYIFNDVDSIPVNSGNAYSYHPYVVHRGAFRNLIYKENEIRDEFILKYNNYFGGIIQLSHNVFSKINGFSNGYWGWGSEDDDIYMRWKILQKSIMGNNTIKYRPSTILGKVWNFPESTERYSQNERKILSGMNRRQYEMMEVDVMGGFVCNKVIMKENGIRQVNGMFKINDYKIDEFFSFYSVELKVSEMETREWGYKKFEELKKQERIDKFEEEKKKMFASQPGSNLNSFMFNRFRKNKDK